MQSLYWVLISLDFSGLPLEDLADAPGRLTAVEEMMSTRPNDIVNNFLARKLLNSKLISQNILSKRTLMSASCSTLRVFL